MLSEQHRRSPDTAPDPSAADTHYYRQVLHELIDIGADLARLVHQQALSQAAATQLDDEPGTTPTSSAADATIAFDRTARAIRRTITLARHLAEPAAWPAHRPTYHRPAYHRTAARARIIRDVEDAIQRTAGNAEAGSLHAEFLDRLDAPDLDDDIEHRPVADIIADICRDLGIAAPSGAPWKRRTPGDVATLCARAANPRIPAQNDGLPTQNETGATLPHDITQVREPRFREQ